MGSTTRTDRHPLGGEGGRQEAGQPNEGAPHAAYPPRAGDRLTRALTRALPPLWTALGLHRGAATLRHYLAGTGSEHRVDATDLLTLPLTRAAVADRLALWRREAAARGPDVTHRADSGWQGLYVRPRDGVDWWLTLRGLEYRLTGTVRVCGDGRWEIRYRFRVYKIWNFDRGESEFGVPFTPFARLHETGLAREFPVAGETAEHVVRGRDASLLAPDVSPGHPGPMSTRAHVVVTGTVQGVFFRDTCRRLATEAGLAGWVRNLPDGGVEAVFEGDEAAVASLVDWAHHGPPAASVLDVQVTAQTPEGLTDFEVR
ncbi:acylphosphatase [Streptomyces sp. NPDC059740]|uniref:acylphosphatase n=1 Tax=Streptomyces sp. NPDC059740 TaxID=3346926 RepID=UPI00365F4167